MICLMKSNVNMEVLVGSGLINWGNLFLVVKFITVERRSIVFIEVSGNIIKLDVFFGF